MSAHTSSSRDRAQAAHDPSHPERVGDRLAQAVALGDVEIDNGPRAQPADLERRHDVVGAVQGRPSIERCLDACARMVRLGQSPHDDLGRPQALGVDVHQRDRRVARELRRAEDVAGRVAGEDRRARSDEGDLGH
jgi:hypothetical protein